jgi:ABC-type dipeptide/oligopeptide/nickel transport system ATPase component
MSKQTPLLSVQNLRKPTFFTFEGVAPAVDNVSFELRTNETLGILGESGCGKSVTALSIMRLMAEPPGRKCEVASNLTAPTWSRFPCRRCERSGATRYP